MLKPDYSSTMDLGLQRSAGTLLGGGLGVAAAQLGHLGPGGPIATAIGSVLAIAAYIAWPTWEGPTAHEKYSRLLEAHRDYIRALLRALRTRNPDLRHLRSLQAVARALIAPVNRLASAELALHALVISPSQHDQALVDGCQHRLLDERLAALDNALTDAIDTLESVLRRCLSTPPTSPRPSEPGRAVARRQ